MGSGDTIETLRTAARSLSSVDDRSALKAIQAAQDALDAAKSERLASMSESKGYELDGASSIKTWARNELRLDASEADRLVRAGATMRDLPDVSEAARTGRVRTVHLDAFAYGLRHLGRDIMTECQPWLLDVATACEPAALRKVVRDLREAVYPDSLDQKWMDGMAKQDLHVDAVPEGWHVRGFLNITTGAKFKTVLDAIAAPRSAEDQRTGADRRVTALDDLCTQILESGLPTDKGVRPHLSLIVEAEAPARLARFGSIGPKLLDYLACGADVTGILTTGGPLPQATVLNVGRSHRVATLKQRRAILARQNHTCAAPGCRHTHLEIHHLTPWSEGGRTDLDQMVGLCVRCHHLLHAGHLSIADWGDGPFVTGRDPRPARDAYRKRLAAWRETVAIRRLATDVRHRHDRPRTPLRT